MDFLCQFLFIDFLKLIVTVFGINCEKRPNYWIWIPFHPGRKHRQTDGHTEVCKEVMPIHKCTEQVKMKNMWKDFQTNPSSQLHL